MMELLAKIMAQLMSILALSTNSMKERRISWSIQWIYVLLWLNVFQETFLKRLIGKADLEDAFQRLDTLTREENLMTAARTFEATFDIDVNMKATQELTHLVENKVKAIEEVVQHVDGNIKVIKEGTRSVDDNVRETKRGTPIASVL